jgi:hypothetical protein
MRQILSVLRNFRQIKGFHSLSSDKLSMDEVAKDIFYAAVESVKPSELITKNKFLSYTKKGNKELIEINHKGSRHELDVTDKNIHIGNNQRLISACQVLIINTRLS